MATGTEIERLLVRLVGDATQYQKMLRDAQNQTKKAAKDINTRIAGIGRKMTQMGKSLSLKVTAPIVAVGAAAVHSFAKFDKAMIESTSIMKVTIAQTERMRKTALSLSVAGTQGPAELARSYFFLASAGLDAEQSMKALPKLMKFATAGAFDMALATDLLTDAQSALGLTVKDNAEKNAANMQRLADVLVKANTLANASVQQFSEALTNTAAASLRSFGKDVEEGVALLAAYADQGIKANVAGTNLSRVMLLLSKSSRDNADAHRELGFSVFDAQGKMRNFADIIKNLEDITRGMSDETKSATLAQLGFAARVQQAILPLLGTSSAIRGYEKELRNAGGTTDKVANKQMKSFSNQLKLLKNQLSVAGIEIGKAFAPILLDLAKKLKGVAKWIAELSDTSKKWLLVLGGAVAVIGPVLVIVGQLAIAYTGLAAAIVRTNAAQLTFLAKFKNLAVLLAANPGVAIALAAFASGGLPGRRSPIASNLSKQKGSKATASGGGNPFGGPILDFLTFAQKEKKGPKYLTGDLPTQVFKKGVLPEAAKRGYTSPGGGTPFGETPGRESPVARYRRLKDEFGARDKKKLDDLSNAAYEKSQQFEARQRRENVEFAKRAEQNDRLAKSRGAIAGMKGSFAVGKMLGGAMAGMSNFLGGAAAPSVNAAVGGARDVLASLGEGKVGKKVGSGRVAMARSATGVGSLEARNRLAEFRARIGSKSEPVKQTTLLGLINTRLEELVGITRDKETGAIISPAGFSSGGIS